MQMIIEPKRFLHKTSSHLYVQPHPFLKKAVAHYTILQESAYTGQETLLLVPDISGCIVFKVKKNTIDAQYWGPTTKLVEVQAEPDEHIAVKLQQRRRYKLLGSTHTNIRYWALPQ